MGAAMQDLEDLLSEALRIANDVANQDGCEHISSENVAPPVFDNKPAREQPTPSDDDKASDSPVLAQDPQASSVSPTVFAGARRNLAEYDPDHGNIKGPILPDRTSSLNTEKRHSPTATDSSLPSREGKNSAFLPSASRTAKQKATPQSQERKENDQEQATTQKNQGRQSNPNGVREYIRVFNRPPITPRESSMSLVRDQHKAETHPCEYQRFFRYSRRDLHFLALDGGSSDDVIDFTTQYNVESARDTGPMGQQLPHRAHAHNVAAPRKVERDFHEAYAKGHPTRGFSLRKRSHVSLREGQMFNLAKSVKRQPIARDWPNDRKRLVATVSCISTALIGVLIGIYAGIVPSVQYYIADFNHYAIIGNVGFYAGMSLPPLFFWPLPLLHGRKPYIMCSLCVALPLLFPQAITVASSRSPDTPVWRIALLLPRALMGFALGFASMNFHSILTDLFGASLMSSKPHQEIVDEFDVRRHGGGLGVWLGIWTWCWIGSIAVGFLIGAVSINYLRPCWGLYICIALVGLVLLLNVLCPEVRRAAWRRSVTEVREGASVSRRVARGEVMMHRVKDGPRWWGQEVYHGMALCLEMLRQPGFIVMAVYCAWIYAQIVLIIVLLGALTSRSYRFRPHHVGACVSSVAIGALAAVPFQKANLFSRARHRPARTNSMTFNRTVTWTSHFIRRVTFVLVLPLAAIGYTLSSVGPALHIAVPCVFAGLVGFLSCLAISECNGMLMETWDCSDLQPGMTGYPVSGKESNKRTNYSSYPRVTAGFAIIHSLAFILAAVATAVGGTVQRRLGQRAATGVVAGILFILSCLLLVTFIRFHNVQIVPRSRSVEMETWTKECQDSLRRQASVNAAAKASGIKRPIGHSDIDVSWRPIVLGNPASKCRRVNILELGSLTRWSEIRTRNRLIDEGAHLNRQTVEAARKELVRQISKRSLKSRRSQESDAESQPRGEIQDLASPGPPGSGLEHRHPQYPDNVYRERDCFMGQTVPEELEEVSSLDGGSDVDQNTPHDGHVAHATPKVRPYPGLERKDIGGSMCSSSDVKTDVFSDGHQTSTFPRSSSSLAELEEESRFQQEHGAHMHQSKVRVADQGPGDHAHGQMSRVRAADLAFEDVDLGDSPVYSKPKEPSR